MVEHSTHWRSDAPASGDKHGDITDLIAELAVQIETVHRVFTRSEKPRLSGAKDTDVVFIDDLAHCMECSWAKREAATDRINDAAVAECSRLLEASLQVLRRVETLHAEKSAQTT